MAEDYGYFADGSSAAFGCGVMFRVRSDSALKATQGKMPAGFLPLTRRRRF
jgi:hypothetical protein